MLTARGESLVAVTTTFLILSLLALGLRIYSRYAITKVRLGLEDVFLVVAWIFGAALWGIILRASVAYGVGKYITDLTSYEWEHLTIVLQMFWAAVFLYPISLACTKLSLFLQYLRLFPAGLTRWASWAGVVLVTANMVWGVLVGLFACTPVRKVWDPFVPGSCLPRAPVWLALAGSNIATSCIIILVPIPAVLRLQMAWKTKLALCSVFCLGILDIILSILRLTSVRRLARTKDITFDLALVGIWSLLEAFVAVIGASVAVLRPLFRVWAKRLFGIEFGSSHQKYSTSTAARSHRTSGIRSSTYGHPTPRVDDEENVLDTESTQSFGLRPTTTEAADTVPMGKIHVKQEVSQTWHG